MISSKMQKHKVEVVDRGTSIIWTNGTPFRVQIEIDECQKLLLTLHNSSSWFADIKVLISSMASGLNYLSSFYPCVST